MSNRIERTVYDAYEQIGIDAGGRQRVSQITTLLDGKVTNGHTSLLLEDIGTGTHSLSGGNNNMTVASGEYCIFQSRRFYPYFSGKSTIVETTFDGFGW